MKNKFNKTKVFFAETPYVERPAGLMSAIEQKYELVDHPGAAAFVLVYGGDGTMLRAIREYRHENNRFVGIHGGTVGFLMNESAEAVLEADELHFIELWLIQGTIVTPEGDLTIYGFNDIWIERSTERVLKIRMTIDGREVPQVILADGMVASTPQGSTGYNRAARGKVIMPGVPVLQLTPIAAMVDKTPLGSLILSEDSEIILKLEEQEKRPARIMADNRMYELPNWKELRLKKSNQWVQLGFARENVFLERIFSAQYHI
ncbi:MAG: NAD kinase [Gammaproteobacteria bacterium]